MPLAMNFLYSVSSAAPDQKFAIELPVLTLRLAL